ncbi:MAG: DUF108 domain-containing protein [Candidatus Omnitrophica bacterium]|jgi:aspartate dehydrogenase|nr:DUF108 domain-containing protein [Candidatus Omnitrophota bacterium]
MRKKIRIGIVGCGAIGSSLAKAITKEFSADAYVSALFDTQPDKAQLLSVALRKDISLAVSSLKDLISFSDFIIESSSAQASGGICRQAVNNGKDILVMSVGGLLKSYPRIFNLAKKKKVKVYIPSGAIGGVDALKALNLSDVKKVTLTTTKNPIAFKKVEYLIKKRIVLSEIKSKKVLFYGNALRAVRCFPQNINVAAVLSLVGIGAKQTKVKIVASPKVNKNIHEVQIISRAGNFYSRSENVLHPGNPKTSYLAFLSAKALLRDIFLPVKIGT